MPAPRGNSVCARRAGIRACESGVSPSHEAAAAEIAGGRLSQWRRDTPLSRLPLRGQHRNWVANSAQTPIDTLNGRTAAKDETRTCFPFDSGEEFDRSTREHGQILTISR
jgi:hypothetical protein